VHRKIVTVVFCDMVGSTALGESTDPEALRTRLARYFERMKAIVERHGGSVEKFIGDAVMAVFGVPAVHEDDALRACRAAVEMRDAFAELGIQGRIGVNTGEVVTGTEERLATGDPVNVAARLQQAAAPNEVLIGEATLALVRPAVGADPVEPLELRGKSEPVRAYRLGSVSEAPERSHVTRFVGRKRELGLVREAWERALTEQRCESLTIVADAGIGKSRLAAEALAQIDARVVRGRCLSYGEGITYWPVVEALKQLGAVPSDPAAAAAIRSLLGQSDQGTSAEEIAWAFRRLLEEQAPLVVGFDDIQWGEETFLDLVESVSLGRDGRRACRCRRPTDASRPPRDALGSARGSRTGRPRTRRRRGRALPPQRRPGPRPRRGARHAAARGADPEGADPARPGGAPRRRRLSLSPPADPRRRLRRLAQVEPSGVARALRRLARGPRVRTRRAGRDSRVPPRAGRAVPG
jgi:class 3 adenylate cyclase